MDYYIGDEDAKTALQVLRAGGAEATRIANEIEGQALRGELKCYDPPMEFKQYISDLITYLREQFDLHEYRWKVNFRALRENAEQQEWPFAEVKVDDTYLWYTIQIDQSLMDEWKAGAFRTVGESICHELCHVLMEPVVRWAKADAAPSKIGLINETEERQTQRFARTISDALPEGWYAPDYVREWRERNRPKAVVKTEEKKS